MWKDGQFGVYVTSEEWRFGVVKKKNNNNVQDFV